MAVSIKAATATVNSTSKKSTKATKENTVNMTQEQLAAIIATAVAQAIAATTATAVVAAPVATKQTLDQAISGSVSNRFINWVGATAKTAANKTAPVIGKVEVLAVPVTLHMCGTMLTKSGEITDSIGSKLGKWGKASTAASIARTPGVEMNALEAQLNGMSKADLIALIAQSAK
jgi:hypothetical protein